MKIHVIISSIAITLMLASTCWSAEGHTHGTDDAGINAAAMHVASMIVCPEYCDGTMLAACRMDHRSQYFPEITSQIKAGASENAVAAALAEKYGMHVLRAMALAEKQPEPVKTGVVTGIVTDESKLGEPVPNVDVKILIYDGEQGVDAGTMKTNDKGEFLFEGLPIRAVTGFQAIATYQRAEYASAWVALTAEKPKSDATIPVYPSTDDDSELTILQHRLMVNIEDGYLSVTEVMIAMNPGTSTIVGKDASSGAFSINLPEGAFDIMYVGAFDEEASKASGGRAVSILPFTPGQKQFTIRYSLPVDKTDLVFRHVTRYFTSQLDFMFPESEDFDTTLESDDFPKRRVSGMGKRAYIIMNASDLRAGREIKVKMLGLPIRPKNEAKWPALALVVAAALAIAASFALPKSSADGGR